MTVTMVSTLGIQSRSQWKRQVFQYHCHCKGKGFSSSLQPFLSLQKTWNKTGFDCKNLPCDIKLFPTDWQQWLHETTAKRVLSKITKLGIKFMFLCY